MPISTEKLAGDGLALDHPGRCRVCALPLPAKGAEDGICSRRCADRRRESAAVAREESELKEKLLAEVANLKAGTTVCPGELSHRVLPGTDQPLTVLRPLIFELSISRRLRLSQKGTITLWQKIHGPFRVGR
ncbi:MAG: hypothetical protein V4689_15165 [Verrucomicrobiota bacterium]